MSLRRTLTPLALLGLLTFTLPACAQSQEASPQQRSAAGARGGDAASRVQAQVSSLSEAVNLTASQTAQIRELLEAEAADRPARGTGDRQAMREQMQARRAETTRKIEALLTPEQIPGFRTWQEAQRQNQRGRRGGRGNGRS
ncbi:hypothetical protein [Rubricoccus marinus]|uniref:Periplasmic heavy metal sensor n=1 Tax=Rubricoccus marinus TaxID=716817 RepID=A0A259U203_9BACT|nr:hypothetical protein [Rubricoccus marinus]OZC03844.1 hypothetical protein BSZ36_13120 [Rubricoccus marinus]